MAPRERDRLVDELRLPKPRNAVGRDLPAAIAAGVGLGALALVSILVGPALWYPVIAAAAALATWEVASRLRESDCLVPRTVLILGGQAIIWLTWPLGLLGMVHGLVGTVLLASVHRLFFNGMGAPPRNWLRDTSVSVFIAVWIPVCVAFAAMLSRMEPHGGADPRWYIVTFMLCVVANDVGGYATGVFFGRHPMAPAVSPKKSWEGFAGSLALGAAVGVATSVGLLGRGPAFGVVVGLLLAVSATMGDLLESQFKRDLGIKDMSAMIPGHGGLMDRLDGMLPAAAVMWLLATALTAP